MYAPLYVAAHMGLYAKNGLDVEINSAGGIALPIPLLLSGRSLIGVTSPGMSVNARREGASIKNIAKIVGGVSMWAIARPGSEIASIEDLKGKTIATLKFPSSTIQVPTFAINKVLGMTPEEAGITFLELPPGPRPRRSRKAARTWPRPLNGMCRWVCSSSAWSRCCLSPTLSGLPVLPPPWPPRHRSMANRRRCRASVTLWPKR